MASSRREHAVEAVNDANYGFVWLLTILALYALVPLALAYLWMAVRSLTGEEPRTPWRPR
jgi:hypothetical protein